MELHLLALNGLLSANSFYVIFKAKYRIKGKMRFLRNAGKIAYRDMTEKPTLSSSVFHALSFHLFLYSFFPIFFLQGISTFLFLVHLFASSFRLRLLDLTSW